MKVFFLKFTHRFLNLFCNLLNIYSPVDTLTHINEVDNKIIFFVDDI